MKDEYDFSNAERGRFYHPEALLNIPIYLDADVQKYFPEKTEEDTELPTSLNEPLR